MTSTRAAGSPEGARRATAGEPAGAIAQHIANAAGVPETAPDSFLSFDKTTGGPFIRRYRFGEFVTSETSEVQLLQ